MDFKNINTGIEEDFFSELDMSDGVVEKDNDKKTEEPENNDKEPEKGDDKNGKKSEPKKEDDFFQQIDNGDGFQPNNTDDNNDELELVKKLKEKGVIDFDINDEELDEDDLLEKAIESTVSNKIKEMVEDLPEDNRQVVNFLLKGGNVNELLNKLSSIKPEKTLSEDLDLYEEKNQELVMRELLAKEGYDEDYINTHIEVLKDTDKLQMMSEKKFNKWKKEMHEKKKAAIEMEEKKLREEERIANEKKRALTKSLKQMDNLQGIPLTKKDKENLSSYIYDRNVKLENGTKITKLQKEMFYDLPNNPTAYLQFAVLMNNRNEDGTFNFENIKKEINTQVAKKVKDNVRRSKNNHPGKSTGRQTSYANTRLADYF